MSVSVLLIEMSTTFCQQDTAFCSVTSWLLMSVYAVILIHSVGITADIYESCQVSLLSSMNDYAVLSNIVLRKLIPV